MGLFVPAGTATAATSGIFGAKEVTAPRPIFGLGPSAGTIQGTAINYGSTPLSQYMMQQQLAAMAQAGFPSMSPEDFESALDTPEAQRQANETALAKIATANPQLAEELAAKMDNEGQDQSLWENVKDIGGDLIGGIGKLGAGLLDIVSRPARIIPELIVDEENDAWYEDIAQALSGNSRATGAKVLEKWGVENGWAKGIGGFAFDVLADPLTWVTFGTAGLGRRIAAEAGGTIVAKHTLREAITNPAAMGIDDLDGFINQFGRLLTEHSGTASVNSDALPGLVANALNIGDDALSAAVMKAAAKGDQVARGIQQGSNIKKITSMEELAALREVAKQGGYIGRQASAALGGMRLRAAVPFMKERTSWVSGALPGTEGVHLFGVASNFFRGTSGMTKLTQYLNANPNIDPKKARDMMQTWMDEGYKGFATKFHTTASEMGGGKALSLGSGYLSVAHRMGKATAYMNPHANLYRHGGLAGIATMNAAATARSLRKAIYDDAFQLNQETDEFTGQVLPKVSRANFQKMLRPIRDAQPGRKAMYNDWLEDAPSASFMDLDDAKRLEVRLGAHARIRDNAIARAQAQLDEGILSPQQAEAKIAKAEADFNLVKETATDELTHQRDLWNQFTDDEKAALGAMRRGFNQIMNAGNSHGTGIGARNVTYDFAHAMQEDDIAAASRGGDQRLNGVVGRGPGAELYAVLPNGVPDLQAMATHTDLKARGIRFGKAQSSLPPVPAGKVRLYRGEVPGGQKIHGERSGGFFTTDKTMASGYGDLHYVDVDVDSLTPAQRAAVESSYDGEVITAVDDSWRKAMKRVPDEPQRVRVGMRAEEPLMLRGAQNLEGHDALWAKWEGEIREMLGDPDRARTFLKEGEDALSPERTEELVSEFLTQRAQKAGFDAVVRYNEADEVIDGVYLMDPKSETSAIWAVDPTAAQVRPERGYLPHMRSPEFRVHEEGEIGEGAYHPGDLLHAKHRKADETLRQANARLKDDPEFTGEDALITDPLRMYDLYATHVAEGAAREVLGLSTKRIGSLYGGGANEMVTWLNRYAVDKGFLSNGQLANMSAKAREVYENQAKRTDKALQIQEKLAGEHALRLRLINEEIAGIGRTQVAVAARRAKGSAVKAGVSVGKQIVYAQKRQLTLMKALKEGRRNDSILQELDEIELRLAVLNDIKTQYGKGHIPKADAPFKINETQAKLSQRAEARLTRLDKQKEALERRARTQQTKIEGSLSEIDKIRTRLETHAATPTPAFTTDGSRAGYVRLESIANELAGLHAHPFIAKELESALAGRHISALQKQWRQWVNGPWKSMATVYFPGFHVRNNMGAWFNNFLGGVSSEHYRLSFRVSKALDPESKWFKPTAVLEDKYIRRFGLPKGTTYNDLAQAIHNHGVRGSNSLPLADGERRLVEIRNLVRGKNSRFQDVREAVGDKVPITKAARAATEITENWHRQAAFLRGLEVSGGKWGQARAFTMMRHGDYEDLNDFEEGIKDLIPFYKWLRTNVPFQVRQLIENPGKQLGTIKAARNAAVIAGQDPDELQGQVPSWMNKSLAFPLRAFKNDKGEDILSMVALDLPLADLSNGLNDYLGSFLPVIRPLIENQIGVSVWSGVPIEGKKIKAAGWMGLPVIRQMLEPFLEEDAEGNLVMDDRTANTLSAVPIFSRFRNWVLAEDTNVARRMSSLGSAFLGVRQQDAGPDQLTSAEKEFFYNEIQPVIDELRELGVKLPEPAQVSPAVYSYLGFSPPKEGE